MRESLSGCGELVLGLGCRPATGAVEILHAVREVLGDNSIRCIATIDRRAGEPGIRTAAAEWGVPVVVFTADELAEVQVPNPARRTRDAVATGSVAEAAALRACEKYCSTVHLVVPKVVLGSVTVAVAGC